jgi:hypothetical protein
MNTTFKINQKVFVYTKDGMKETKIIRIDITITESKTIVNYGMDNYDYYSEEQILPTLNLAKERLIKNSEQMILLLD